MTSTTLITGAAGFIGSHLTDRLLAQGQQVVGLDNFCDFYDPAIKHANLAQARTQGCFSLVEADLRDRDAVVEAVAAHRPDTVVHLAAMAGVRPSIENPAYYTAVNLNGTVNLLDAAVAQGCKRFIFASSSSVYGNNKKTPFSEDDRVDHPISPYAATKKAGELICHSYSHLYQLPITCLRFFTVFGPRQRPDLAINKFLRLVRDGKPIPMFGDGSTSRDYTFVDDIVDGVTAAIDRCGEPDRYRIYNLGGHSPVSLREMIATVERVVGKAAQIDRQPMQPGDVDRTWADLTRVKAELGFEPATSLEEGIARQWQWMQERENVATQS
ncbi:GDP-mannose 4,6-dehydratase [Phycisphaerales bacterium AB-hyl4]|uniref:GDP-mannose 4,6-dehydratase n=1 Tax=Natronomicrosphaera hydrolytica TaxID=3242702 RepID=A0ABV4U707_9BACT